MSSVNVDRLNAAIDMIVGSEATPVVRQPRGMLVPASEQTSAIDDPVGVLLNTDGNAWNIVMIVGALLGVERDVRAVRDNAVGKFPPSSYVAGNAWLQSRAQEFAQKLLPLCGLLTAAAFAPGGTSTVPPESTARQSGVVCESGGDGCILVANGGDGTCPLAGSGCVLGKGTM